MNLCQNQNPHQKSHRILSFVTLVTTVLAAATSVVAQDPAQDLSLSDSALAYRDTAYAWKNSAIGNLNLNQSHFDNWTKGGTDAL